MAEPPGSLGVIYRYALRPILFALPAESAHACAALYLAALHRHRWLRRAIVHAPPVAAGLGVQALGRTFASPLGLAAGFDKNASLYNGIAALGFAFVEVGTITAEAQSGNPRPRLFRLREDRALINRMGFNNPGAAAASRALARHAPDGVVLGVNLGKTKTTALEHAAQDYASSTRQLARHAHYLVINVSSPNTPGLRSLQSVDALRPIVAAVQQELAALPTAPPILVKLAPDLADDDIDAIADLALELGLAGIVATNTTIARDTLALRTPADRVTRIGAGGLSGAPLRERALAVIRRIHRRTHGRLTIIGAGGIENADHAWNAMTAGASLVQVYTAMVYEGPGFARALLRDLATRMAERGVARIGDIVGTDSQS